MPNNIDLGEITGGPNWWTPDATFTMDGDHTYTATSAYDVNAEFYYNFGFTVTTTESVSFSVSATSTTIGPMGLLFGALVTPDSAAGTADGFQFNSTYDEYFTDGFSATLVPGSYVLTFHVDNSFGNQALNFVIGQSIIGAATLFTTGADVVNFNSLEPSQKTAIASGANLYSGSGGSDVVTLPSVANYNESLGGVGGTLNWDPSSTFSTGSLAGDTYTVNGSDGSYNIELGAGSDSVNIKGNGSSTIAGGSGHDTITIDGTGASIVNAGSGNETLSIAGGGSLEVIGTFAGSATIGVKSTLELNGPASGGAIAFSFNGVSTSPNETLKIDGTVMPVNQINGLAIGDTIDLAGVGYVQGRVGTAAGIAVLSSGNFLNVTEAGTTYQLKLDPTQKFLNQSFSLSPDGQGGTDVSLVNDPTLKDFLEFSALSYALTPTGFLTQVPQTTNFMVPGFTQGVSTESNAGLTALTFVDDTKGTADYDDVVIAFRGSVTKHDWLVSDSQLAIGLKPAEFDAAVNFITQQVESAFPISEGYSYFVTGHSLGAAEAEDTAAVLGLGGDTFAAPGVSNILTSGGVLSNGANLTDYNIADDPVANHTALSGQHVGTVVTLPSVHFSSTLFGGLVGLLIGLQEHPLGNYGQALARAGLIPSNPLPIPSQPSTSSPTFENLNELVPNIANVTTQTDASGDVTESGTVSVITSLGTAVETVTEEETTNGDPIFTTDITSGQETASQIVHVTAAGLISDQIILNGVDLSTPLSELADIGVASDGSLLVGTESSAPGDEVTIDALTNGTDEILTGGDSQVASKIVAEPSAQGLLGLSLNVSSSGKPTYSLSEQASLTKVGNQYDIYAPGTTSGPSLKLGGAVFTAGSRGAWTPIAAVQTGNGYEVALKNGSSDQYTVWNTNGNGNYISNVVGAVSGKSAAFESIETTFNQDLNGDGVTGATTSIFQTDGVTSLVEIGNQYFIYRSLGQPLLLHYAGAPLTAGEFGGFSPVGAVQTATGYEIVRENPDTNTFTFWATDSNGNYVSTLAGPVSGTSYAVESRETTFGQDLNGDGTIGPTKTLIQTDGSTSLTQVANEYFLYAAGGTSGPSLKVGGAAVTVGEFSDTAPVGAIKTATGYDIAMENPDTNTFTFWATDSNGNYLSNITGSVPGTNATLKLLERAFYQDFNGDGVIDTPTTVVNVTGHVVLPLSSVIQPAAIAKGATLELTGADSSSVTFKGTTGTLQLDSSTSFSGTVAGMTGQDTLDLRDINFANIQTPGFSGNNSGGTLSVTDGTRTANIALIGNYMASTFVASSDGHGGTLIVDPHAAANQNVLLAQSQHA